MQRADLEAELHQVPVIGIVRGLSADATAAEVTRLIDSGIRVIEATIETDDALPSLDAAVAVCRERGVRIGVGSVIDVPRLAKAYAREVDFTVAPGLDLDVVAAARHVDRLHIPGVATATEITGAVNAGSVLLKIFPARQLGTPWLRAQRAPFPRVGFIATGGLEVDDAAEWLDAGCLAIGVGSPRITANIGIGDGHGS